MDNAVSIAADERAGRRAQSRLRVRLPARLITLDLRERVVLTDVSTSGAQIVIGRSLPPGREGVLQWAGFEAFGVVSWAAQGICGLCFLDPVAPAVLVATRALDDAERLPRDSDLTREIARSWVSGAARL